MNDVATTVADPVSILLVDDQPGRLLSYRAILDPLGERLIEASSGTEALRQLMQEECAVILLDVNMPGMDGFETASLIHQHPRFEKTPIIFVSAVNVSDMDRLRGYKLGAVDYVMVPIIPEILRSKVMVLAELHRKRRELQLANEQLAQANETLQAEKVRELDVLNESLRVANTELAQRNDELQAEITERSRAEARLLELDRRKDEFLATLSHELRNPLASLSNAIHVMQLSGQGGDSLHETMQRQMSLLVRLIDDLLDIARIGQDKLVLRKARVALDQVIEAARETVAPLLAAGGHRLDVQLPDEAVAVDADPERLSQVFSNLLNNAAKYSDDGSPITLVVLTLGEHVEIRVEDHGIGLAPDQVERIFEPFSQVDTSVERSRSGLGIGLTLVRRLVELHGGTIDVHSAGLGQGSCFTVRLPRCLGPASAVIDRPGALVAGGNGRRCRVLVIDDNRDSADTLAMMLELGGHDVRRIYDPHEAVGETESFSPEVVFLDIGMPGLSGYDVARMLRATGAGSRAMIVAMTGWGQPEDRRRTAEAGFDHHMVKPPALEALAELFNQVPQPAGSVP